jgi:hypothetical protein
MFLAQGQNCEQGKPRQIAYGEGSFERAGRKNFRHEPHLTSGEIRSRAAGLI